MNTFCTENLIKELINEYGTPAYLYDQGTIERQIDKMQNLVDLDNVHINYATKANSNPNILKIMRDKGLKADATGSGEVYLNKYAGFEEEMIYVVGNNFTKDELINLCQQDLVISLDSIEQIDLLNEVAPKYQKVMLRVNPSFGAGDNESIITGGSKHKFGIDIIDLLKAIIKVEDYGMKLIGINQHIGSLNLNYKTIIEAVVELLGIIKTYNLNDLSIINFGGGFGINYYRRHYFEELDFGKLTRDLTKIFNDFLSDYQNKDVSLEFEPGRFLVAEAGILVGQVTSIKERGDQIYIGTDLGFNNFIRPTLYDSYHEVEFLTENTQVKKCNVVGNMCESGDFVAKNRALAIPNVGDLVIVYDTGAYGYCMSSNYNNKLKPIELLIDNDQDVKVIRKRETYEDILRGL